MDLLAVIDAYQPRSPEESADLERMRGVALSDDPWSRSQPLHATGSAIIVHPASRRVLLRWHQRMQGWLQVGGHADPGESDPYAIALREATEETGLADLESWPDPAQPTLVQITVVPVPAGKGEPAHHHADLRYVIATRHPEAAIPESENAPLRWLDIGEASATITEDNLRVCFQRVDELLRGGLCPADAAVRLVKDRDAGDD